MPSALVLRPDGDYLAAVATYRRTAALDPLTVVDLYAVDHKGGKARHVGKVDIDGIVTAATFTPAGDRLILGTDSGKLYIMAVSPDG